MKRNKMFTPLAIILAMAMLAVLPGWGAIPARADAPPDVHFPLVYFEAYDCLQKPTLLAPPDGTALESRIPLFQWDAGHPVYARLVQLNVARDPDFARLAASMSTSAVEGEGSFRFPSNFEPGITYYWRTRFVCRNGVEGPWTEAWSFTTGTEGEILPAPVQQSPANGSVVDRSSLELVWDTVPGAVLYLVRWREVGSLGSMYRWSTETRVKPFGIQPGKRYEWWVAAVSEYAIGEESPKWQFTAASE